MKKRISKRVREEAAVLCAIAASWPDPISVSDVATRIFGIERSEAPRHDHARLACRAWEAAHNALVIAGRNLTDHAAIRDDYAEAEALLRTGWSPE